MGTPNRNQHWVPQFYLRGFATPESRDTKCPKIWAFPINEGDEFRTHTRNVAAKRDLYSFCAPDVDKRLSDLESMLGGHWPTLTQDRYPIDLGFKRGISLFIATLYLRHPAELERERRFIRSMAKVLEEGPRDDEGRTSIAAVSIGEKTYEINPAELDKYRTLTDDGVQAAWGETILSDSGWIAQELVDRPWTVLVSEEPAFITTDHPVVLDNPSKDDAPILHPETTVCFPMSPTKLVLINYAGENAGHIVQIAKGREAAFNHQIFCSAFQHVFSAWDSIHVMHQVVTFADWVRAELKRQADRILGPVVGIGRNEPCYCGSGRKFKKCCGR